MTYVLIILISVSIALIILSFFMDDKFVELENKIEQLSNSTMLDTYQIKKELKNLEEKLLTQDKPGTVLPTNQPGDHKPLVIQKVYHLKQQGYSTDEISGQTGLSNNDVNTILNNSK